MFLGRTEKTFKIPMHGRSIIVSADRVTPPYMLDEADHEPITASHPAAWSTQPAFEPDAPPPPAEKTKISGRRFRFPARYVTYVKQPISAHPSCAGWV